MRNFVGVGAMFLSALTVRAAKPSILTSDSVPLRSTTDKTELLGAPEVVISFP